MTHIAPPHLTLLVRELIIKYNKLETNKETNREKQVIVYIYRLLTKEKLLLDELVNSF